MVAAELWVGKAIACSELSGLFCVNSRKDAERNVDNRDLDCETSEGSFESFLKKLFLKESFLKTLLELFNILN